MKGKKARKLLKKAVAKEDESWALKTHTAETVETSAPTKSKKGNDLALITRISTGNLAKTPNFLETFWNSSDKTGEGLAFKRPLRFTNLFQNLESPDPAENLASKGVKQENDPGLSSTMKLDSKSKRTSCKRLSFRDVVDIIYHSPPFGFGRKRTDEHEEPLIPVDVNSNFGRITASGTWPPPSRSRSRPAPTDFSGTVVADKSKRRKSDVNANAGSTPMSTAKIQKLAVDPVAPVQNNRMIQSCVEFEALLQKKREALVKKIEVIQKYVEQVEQIDKTLLEVQKQKSLFAEFVDSGIIMDVD